MNDVLTISYAGTVEEQLDQTVRSTRDKLLRFIRARVSDIEDAEDILQDVFYQFVAASDPEEPIGQASSWLYKVAKNKITDWYRKKKPQYFSKFALDPGADEIAELRDEASPSPEQRVEELFFREAVNKVLGELPKAQRDVFLMHEVEGISFEQIAEITGDPVNTLLSRKRYALKYLRRRLQDFDED